MAQQVIITVPENSGEGTPLATAFDYCNNNFSQLFSRVQTSPPTTLIGKAGDQAGMYAYDSTYFYYCFANYDGSSVIWAQLTQAGNISATQIQYGNTIVDIATPNANITFTVNSYPNRMVIGPTQTSFSSNVAMGQNLVVVKEIFNQGNAHVTGFISASGNVLGDNVYANTLLHTGGEISAVGNVTSDAYFIGNGSQLTDINVINGNSTVTIPVADGNVVINVGGTTIGTFTSTMLEVSELSATGNIEGNYILGNGSQLTGLPATYANANVAAYLPTYTGNITANVISTTGNIQGANLLTQGIVSAVGNIVTDGYFVGTFVGNVTGNFVVPGSNTQVIFNTNGNADAVGGFTFDINGPNLLTVLGTISAQSNVVAGNILSGYISSSGNVYANIVSATGNVTANYFIGNGSQLTGVYANSDVAAYLPTYTGNIGAGFITATGNIVAGNFRTSGLVSVAGNITAGNISISGTLGATSYSATGNITGSNLNATVAVVSVGNITGSNLITGGYVLATGNVTSANFTTVGIVSAAGNVTAGNVSTAGLVTASGNLTGGNIRTAGLVTATGNIISAAYFIGDGSQLSNINVAAGSKIENGTTQANISSANANLDITVNGTSIVTVSDAGLLTSGLISATGNTISGNISSAGIITATGNLTAGNVATAGVVTATGNITGGNILTAGIISSTGNITTAGVLTVNSGAASAAILNGGANGVGNIGSSSSYFNTLFATATTALYADLAENYTADAEYEPGTVVCFDGSAEVTQCNTDMCAVVAGVVSTRPAYTMNSGIEGTVATVALVGRVPCRVKGSVKRGAMMVSAGDGCARAEANPTIGTVIGKALQSFDGESGTIEIVVGRL